jgi:hypothetical protein
VTTYRNTLCVQNPKRSGLQKEGNFLSETSLLPKIKIRLKLKNKNIPEYRKNSKSDVDSAGQLHETRLPETLPVVGEGQGATY